MGGVSVGFHAEAAGTRACEAMKAGEGQSSFEFMTDTKMRNVELIVGSPVCVMDDLRPESIVNCSAALTGSVGTCVGYVFTYTGSCSWQPLEWQQMVDTMTK